MTTPHLVFSDGHSSRTRLKDFLDSRATTPDPDVFAAYLNWRLPLDNATVHRGIQRRLSDCEARLATPASDEPARALRITLEEVITSLISGASRVAVMTGGGVDSGILLALTVHVGRRLGTEVFAVALDYAAPGDDRPYLAELERHLRCEVVRVSPEEGSEHVDVLDGIDGAPVIASTSAMFAARVHRAQRAGAERILSGVGGDQVFDGRPTSLANLVRRGSIVEAFQRARHLRGFGRPKPFTWAVRPVLAAQVPASIRARRAEHGRVLPKWAGPAFRAFDKRRRQHYRSLLTATLPDRGPFERYMFDAQKLEIEALHHQFSVRSGVPCLTPYTQPAVVHLVRSLPPETLIEGDIKRGLLRAATADLIPKSLLERTDKATFEPALVRFLHAANAPRLLEPYAGVERLSALGLVVCARFAPEIDTFLRRPSDAAPWMTTWCAVALERFLRGR